LRLERGGEGPRDGESAALGLPRQRCPDRTRAAFARSGGGTRPGRFGTTDEISYFAADKKIHLHDLHATLLALTGLDHEKLTYRYVGRDFHLTDVEGRVVKEVFA
jgi:hypothetical protein